MYDLVVNLLDSLGYVVVQQEDDWLIKFLIDKTENYVLDTCGIVEIPEGAKEKIAEKVVGEFLLRKKDSNQLGDNYELVPAIKSIKEGDTQVTYAYGEGSLTPEKRLDTLIVNLTNNFERHISRYRCIIW